MTKELLMCSKIVTKKKKKKLMRDLKGYTKAEHNRHSNMVIKAAES